MAAGPVTHNANGDRTMKGTGLTATIYGYDSFHNLKSVTFPLTGGAVNYDIDGLGRRVGRHRTGSSPSDRYYLLGEGNRILAEYDASGNIVSRFIYATHAHVPDFMIKNSVVYRFITDQLGSVRLVVNVNAASASASIVQQIDYDAWGNVTNTPSTFDQPFGFAGGLWDRDAGLVHFGAREYDPVTGRWLQKDPIRFRGGDTNLYAYAGNDPVNRIDPSGEGWLPDYTYYQFQFPLWIPTIVVNVQLTIDRWGNVYLGGGIGAGTPASNGISVGFGYLEKSFWSPAACTESEVKSFLQGNAINFAGNLNIPNPGVPGAGPGLGVNLSGSTYAVEAGLTAGAPGPGAAGSFNRTYLIP